MKKIEINLHEETTQIIYAKFKGITRQAVKNKINRNQIKYRYIKELNIYLVEIPENEKNLFIQFLKTNYL